MNFALESGLIVDSSFASRQSLLQDLSETGFVQRIVEARSFDDALDQLRTQPHDACLIGPSVSQPRAIELMETGRSQDINRHCAFVAVLNANDPRDPEELLRAGAEILQRPYEKNSFTVLVQTAVRKAKKETLYRDTFGWKAEGEQSIEPTKLSHGSNEIIRLADLMRNGAEELRAVAQQLNADTLHIRPDGSVSLATRDALRLAVERILGQDSPPAFSSFEHHFIGGVVNWFIDRTNLTQTAATERLRKHLVSFREN